MSPGYTSPNPTRARLLLVVACLIGFACAGVSSALAATFPLRWRWSNPRPHGNNIVGMAYAPGIHKAVQVTERGQIYTSDDLDLWLRRESGTTNALRAVTFFGPPSRPRLVIVGEAGKALWSDDYVTFRTATFNGGTPTEWLMGVAASSNQLVAVGTGGAVFTSGNGTNWSPVAAFTSYSFNSVTWGPAGFVAVTDEGIIYHRPTGSSEWQVRHETSLVNWNFVRYANGLYMAVGTSGVTLTSPNGITWTRAPTGAAQELYVAESADGAGSPTRLVAGTNEVRMLSPGATTWSNELLKSRSPIPWTYLSGMSRSNYFLLGGRTGMLSEGSYPTNLPPEYAWQASAPSFRPWLFDVTRLGGLYVAVGDRGSVMSSGDGVDWSLELVPDSATNTTFLGIGGIPSALLAVGTRGSVILSRDPALFSPNANGGVIWTSVPAFTTNDLQGVAVWNNRAFITGDNGSMFSSFDGFNWTSHPTPTTNFLSSITTYSGGLVATGERGTILRSEDGTTWTTHSPGTANWIWRVRYFGTQLIAVGQNGLILTSSNGVTWTTRVSGTTAWLHDACKVGDTWFVFGKFGTFLSSSNLTRWTARDIPTLKSIYTATTDGRQLVAAGIEGVILRAQVLPDLSTIQFLGYQRIVGSNPPVNLFLLGGHTDQRFTLDYRSAFDTNRWVTGPLLEFYDSTGTLFYLDPLPEAPPSMEFYRATLVP